MLRVRSLLIILKCGGSTSATVLALKGLIIEDDHLSVVLLWINSSDLNIVIKERAI